MAVKGGKWHLFCTVRLASGSAGYLEQAGEGTPYERLLGDAMAGNGALFTREDAIEAAWTVVEPVLKTHHRARPYKPGSWGPKEADAIIVEHGRWHNPRSREASS